MPLRWRARDERGNRTSAKRDADMNVPETLPPVGDMSSSLKATGIGLEIALDQAVQPAKEATIEVDRKSVV